MNARASLLKWEQAELLNQLSETHESNGKVSILPLEGALHVGSHHVASTWGVMAMKDPQVVSHYLTLLPKLTALRPVRTSYATRKAASGPFSGSRGIVRATPR